MISARMTERAEELPEVANLPHMGLYGRVENLIVRDFQPSCPQFGYIQVLELFAVLASGAGLSRLKRLPATLELVPGSGPHLTEVADVEGHCPELIEDSAHGFRAGAGARLTPSLVADGVLLIGDRAGGVAVAPAQNREAFAAQTTVVEGPAGAVPVATLLMHALKAGRTG
jgi:hypothetical protein